MEMSTHSPFVGSRPFDTADEAIFHGRADETAALSKLWREHRLTVLHGPAGVGKTSLLRAGVLPRLGKGPPSQVLPVARLAFRADFPLAALPDLNLLTFALLASWFPDESPTRISGSSIHGLLRRNSRTNRHGEPVPIHAAIDQTGPLFRGVDGRDGYRGPFVDELVEASTLPHLHLLIAIRTENLEELLGLTTEAGIPAESIPKYPLRSFGPVAACQAITEPLGDLDHPLATSAQQFVAELCRGGTDIDPALLQIVCGRLWNELPPGNRIEVDRLPQMVDHVLADHCLRALATVATAHGELPRTLLRAFKQIFGRRSGSAGVMAGRHATHRLPDAVMRALEDSSLLRADCRSGKRRYHLRQARLRSVVRRLDPEAADSARQDRPRLAAAEAAFTTGQLEPARYWANAVAAETASDGRLHAAAECLLGTIDYEQGRIEPAVDHYESAARTFGALGDSVCMGMLLAAIGRLKIDSDTVGAVNQLRVALTELPRDLSVKTALAQALWYAGRTQAAIAILDDTLSQDGSTPEALRLRGELLADLNKAEPALRDLDRVNYENRPSSRAAWALAKRTCGEAGSGAPDERELVDDAADSGPVLLRVARLLGLEGDADSAADLAERAVRARRPPLPQHLHKEAERLMAQ